MKIDLTKIIFFSLTFLLIGCAKKEVVNAEYAIVPLPLQIIAKTGTTFVLDKNTVIVYTTEDDTLKRTAEFLSQYIEQSTGLKLNISSKQQEDNAITLDTDYHYLNSEAYQLTVNEKAIKISGASQAGVFYGVQTLRKSIPPGKNIGSVNFSPVQIIDEPRFSYRGMHLDVSRHMFPVDSVKQYIDMLALHNINKFHWHLTDDQGWRLEIKKYPELTKIGAYRNQTVIGKNSGEYDGQKYGGFFTQDEIKDIVKYAQDRFITIIPEVDLPGHMLAALTTYPNLGCTGGPYKVAETWGVFDDVLCAGNDDIYPFLENVFAEVMELFPSEYIHIGGDECPKNQWEKCPKCQAKIKELGLKKDDHHTAEQRLQSYVMQRIEKFINSKGRKIIGWDEILEGGVAPNATIMSWQGTEGGAFAARQGHDAIMTPTSFLYFDYYQALDVKDEIFGIGGYVPVEKVYSYEPVPEGLTSDEQKHIIGTQANIWTEYIKTFSHLQYMALPRMGALAEIQWTAREQKDYNKFLPRLAKMTQLYKFLGYNYATHIFNISAKIETDSANKKINIFLTTFDNAPIYYTLDGTNPDENSTPYKDKISTNEDVHIKAVAIRNGDRCKMFERELNINKATFKTITLANKPWGRYSYAGASTLVDGQLGGDVYASGGWIGFQQDLIATIDLEESLNFSSVLLGTFVDAASWIFNSSEYTIEVSNDNVTYQQIFTKQYEPIEEGRSVEAMYLKADFPSTNARYVRVTAKALQSQPSWADGAGKPAALFVDEIRIN